MTPEEIRDADDSLARLQVPVLRGELEKAQTRIKELEQQIEDQPDDDWDRIEDWQMVAVVEESRKRLRQIVQKVQGERDDLKRQLADVRECNELNATEMQRFQVQANKLEHQLETARAQIKAKDEALRAIRAHEESPIAWFKRDWRTIDRASVTEWWVTDFTHEQIQGSRMIVLGIIENALDSDVPPTCQRCKAKDEALRRILDETDIKIDQCAESKLDRARDLAELGLEPFACTTCRRDYCGPDCERFEDEPEKERGG